LTKRRAHEISLEHTQKFKKLDAVFAPEVVVGENNATTGPFAAAQNRFYRGQIIPIIAGAFDDTNKDFGKIIAMLAREASSGDNGMTISPLVVNTQDRKGVAFPMILQYFKRAIGVAIVRGNAKHKLMRLHYVRATAYEAGGSGHMQRSSW